MVPQVTGSARGPNQPVMPEVSDQRSLVQILASAVITVSIIILGVKAGSLLVRGVYFIQASWITSVALKAISKLILWVGGFLGGAAFFYMGVDFLFCSFIQEPSGNPVQAHTSSVPVRPTRDRVPLDIAKRGPSGNPVQAHVPSVPVPSTRDRVPPDIAKKGSSFASIRYKEPTKKPTELDALKWR